MLVSAGFGGEGLGRGGDDEASGVVRASGSGGSQSVDQSKGADNRVCKVGTEDFGELVPLVLEVEDVHGSVEAAVHLVDSEAGVAAHEKAEGGTSGNADLALLVGFVEVPVGYHHGEEIFLDFETGVDGDFSEGESKGKEGVRSGV